MNSAGTLGNSVSLSMQRAIPDSYIDRYERWALEASGWSNYAWDNTSEDGESLFHGDHPPTQKSLPNNEWFQQPHEFGTKVSESNELHSGAQNTALDAPGFCFFADQTDVESLPLDADISTWLTIPSDGASQPPLPMHAPTPHISSQVPSFAVVDPQEYVTLPGVDDHAPALVPVSLLERKAPRSTLSTLSAAPTSPAVSVNTPSMLSPYSLSLTPALSPSGSSVCSSEDLELDSSVATIQQLNISTPSRYQPSFVTAEQNATWSSTSSHSAYPPLSTFSHPGANPSPPSLSVPSKTTHFVSSPAIVPTLTPETRLSSRGNSRGCDLPSGSKGKPKVGPQRTTGSRSKRTSKPYERKGGTSEKGKQCSKPTPATNVADQMLTCHVCGYIQLPGAGNQRSFKRHLATHPLYKVVEWVCRGVPQSNRQYYGGCNRIFSRKDSLVRHIRNPETDCVSDFVPIPYSFGSKMNDK